MSVWWRCVIGREANDVRRAFPRASFGFVIHAASTSEGTSSTAMDITPVFNQVLTKHNARPVEQYVFRVEDLDEFLKEAYRIVGHVAYHMTAGNGS